MICFTLLPSIYACRVTMTWIDILSGRMYLICRRQASFVKKIAPFFAAQLAPLKEKAQECVITSYAVIAMEITSDVTDSKKKKSQAIMKRHRIYLELFRLSLP